MEENDKRVKEEGKRSFLNGLLTGVLAVVLVGTAVFCVKQVVTLYGNKAAVLAAQDGEAEGGAGNDSTVMSDTVLQKMEAIEKMVDYYYYQEDIDETAMEDGIYR
ncbi:MAG: hypothetical protein K2K54_01170, partial [Lachnospiraceae bacterium]|nr:hypothetical protein [Lachnospiraceae bacterium]